MLILSLTLWMNVCLIVLLMIRMVLCILRLSMVIQFELYVTILGKLQRISTTRKGPWLLCGDFNEILKHEEKIGGLPREPWSMVDFNLMTKVCHLQYLPFN